MAPPEGGAIIKLVVEREPAQSQIGARQQRYSPPRHTRSP